MTGYSIEMLAAPLKHLVAYSRENLNPDRLSGFDTDILHESSIYSEVKCMMGPRLDDPKQASKSNYRNVKEFYKVEQTIGRGAYASVKKAKDRVTGKHVAIKVMSKRKMTADDEMFLVREIEIMRQIDHPNVVRLMDVFEDERHWCLVMELITGGELLDKLLAS